MRLIAMMLIILLVAAGTGFGSAYWALRREPPVGVVSAGPWRSWPNLGSNPSDPYARAIVARTGALPLGSGEGHVFVADRDSGGNELVASCSYRITGDLPAARMWTLTLADHEGNPISDPVGTTQLTAADVLRADDGKPTIALARAPAAGNWLRLPADGRVRLVLRLYDSPVSITSRTLDARSLPSIVKVGCP